MAILDRFYGKGTVLHVKGVNKVGSEVKLYSYYFSNNESNDINVTGIL